MDFSCCQREVETQSENWFAARCCQRNEIRKIDFVSSASSERTERTFAHTQTTQVLRNYNLQKLIASPREYLSFILCCAGVAFAFGSRANGFQFGVSVIVVPFTLTI